ncbi:beta-galactosidase GalA [Dysgonomonas sp. ZJ709]|uniref:beta-galactosidase GalA n=1 Tax=Dysgonomonas sp. ZJ709 TaxID=2709797 RepID=UPI002104F021|nr:beta-galactosidase GalA [Dysgonomonas sp. ZJ709]
MKKITLLVLFLGCMINSYSQQPSSTKAERLSLDNGWKFHLGDIPFPVIKGHNNSYNNAKAARASGAASPTFDDKEWRTLNLPHDWAVEMPFDSTENLSQGYRKRGFGWYRRYFKVDTSDRGKNIELQFDGIATHCTVWVNGTVIHRNWCGYTSFYVDITPLIKYGDEINNIAIRVNAEAQEGWWYEGAGIYRHTWLVKRSPVHIITDGLYANPIKKADGTWEIPTEITLANSGKEDSEIEVEVGLLDKKGNLICKNQTTTQVEVFGQAIAKLNLPVSNPMLWSTDEPTLYKVYAKVKQNGVVIDETITSCGFRTMRFDKDTGFYLNDKPMKIKGVCNHQDHAGVGVAVPSSIWEFRLRKLKEMGVNAYRCAHNPPAREFLEACDSIGIMVMDENRLFNSSPEYISQLQWLIRRDRNHPSVIMWSVFNEEPMQGTEVGYEMVRKMTAEVKKLDNTRPVTAAMNGGLFAPINVSQAVDVVGFNYQEWAYDDFRKANRDMCLTSSEDVSGTMVRGEYVTDADKRLLDSYDTQHPSWGTTHRKSWKDINERPWLAGCFIWTGFDYRGEPTPYTWPTASSNFGIMDLCGFPKMAFYLHQAQWIQDRPIIHLVPHWNWPVDSIGKEIKVMVLSNADKVKLLLNGKTIGEQIADKYEMNTWLVPYAPGKLEAIGYKQGKEVSRTKVETTGNPSQLNLIADRSALNGDGRDAMPITVEVLDTKGRHVPTANIPIEFEISGPGRIIGLGNGNPNSHEPEKGTKRSLFNGLAQVIIQSDENSSGEIILTGKSSNVKPFTIKIKVNKSEQIPSVATVFPDLVLDKWLASPVFLSKPDATIEIADNDMNSWEAIRPGQPTEMKDNGYIMYRTNFIPYSNQQGKEGNIVIKKLTGKAQIWLDSELIATKNEDESKDLDIPFKPKSQKQTLNIIIEASKGDKVGLGGMVTVSD